MKRSINAWNLEIPARSSIRQLKKQINADETEHQRLEPRNSGAEFHPAIEKTNKRG